VDFQRRSFVQHPQVQLHKQQDTYSISGAGKKAKTSPRGMKRKNCTRGLGPWLSRKQNIPGDIIGIVVCRATMVPEPI